MKKVFIFFAILLSWVVSAQAQPQGPVKWAYAFSADGATCYEAGSIYPADRVPLAAFQVNYPGCVVAVFPEPQHAGVPKESLTATIQDGRVVSIQAALPPAVYLHCTLSGGDGQTPVGIANSGSQWRSVAVAFALRQSADPASPIIPASDSFRMRLRDKRTGQARMIKLVALADGQGSLDFSVPDSSLSGELVLDEADFVPVQGYEVKLASPCEIIIFEP